MVLQQRTGFEQPLLPAMVEFLPYLVASLSVQKVKQKHISTYSGIRMSREGVPEAVATSF